MRYANLHTHTDYSNTRLIDSINKVPDIISLAHKLDLRALAITDHEFLGGHLKALEYTNNKIKEEGWEDFKIILGNEIYLCRNGLNKETVEKGEKYPHFILLALDTEGHRQLRELSSRAWERSFMMFLKRVPTWYSDLEEIVMPNQGHIVATSACIGNILGIWFNNGEFDKVEDHIKWCIKVFGEGNFYLEMSPAAYKEQVEYNKFLIGLHNKYNIPLTIATDAHYGRPEDYPIHEAFLKSKEEDRETADFYKYTYLMTADEIYELMSYIDKEIVTYVLAMVCYLIFTVFLTTLIQAALSSKTTSVTEAGNTTILLLMIVVLLYILSNGIITPYTKVTPIMYIISCLPIVSTFFVPSMMIIGQATALQIIVSFVLLVLSIPLIFNFCANVFKNGVLDYTSKKKRII